MPMPKFYATQEMIDSYTAGTSVEGVALAAGRSYGQTYRGLLNAGVVLRAGIPGRAEACPAWVGDTVGYLGARFRLYKVRGKASEHTCPCGKKARDWAYDHSDAEEKVVGTGRLAGIAYSLDPAHYVAMCRKCRCAS